MWLNGLKWSKSTQSGGTPRALWESEDVTSLIPTYAAMWRGIILLKMVTDVYFKRQLHKLLQMTSYCKERYFQSLFNICEWISRVLVNQEVPSSTLLIGDLILWVQLIKQWQFSMSFIKFNWKLTEQFWQSFAAQWTCSVFKRMITKIFEKLCLQDEASPCACPTRFLLGGAAEACICSSSSHGAWRFK